MGLVCDVRNDTSLIFWSFMSGAGLREDLKISDKRVCIIFFDLLVKFSSSQVNYLFICDADGLGARDGLVARDGLAVNVEQPSRRQISYHSTMRDTDTWFIDYYIYDI